MVDVSVNAACGAANGMRGDSGRCSIGHQSVISTGVEEASFESSG